MMSLKSWFSMWIILRGSFSDCILLIISLMFKVLEQIFIDYWILDKNPRVAVTKNEILSLVKVKHPIVELFFF